MMATGDFLRAVYYWKSILRFCERVFHRSKQVCQVPTSKSPSRIERRNSRHPSADRKSRRSRSSPSISASFNRPNSSEWDDDGDRSKWPHQAAASKSANRIGRIESDVCCGRAWIEGHSKIAKADRDLSEWPPVWVGKPKQLCCSFQFWTVRLSAKEKSLSASRTDWPRSTYLILLRGRFWIVLFLCDSMRRNSAVWFVTAAVVVVIGVRNLLLLFVKFLRRGKQKSVYVDVYYWLKGSHYQCKADKERNLMRINFTSGWW